jgi:hypothetical protein
MEVRLLMTTRIRIARAAGAAIAVAAASAAMSAPAHAGILTKSATDCGDPTVSQAFKSYGDPSNYKVVGDFENGAAGWTLTGGAKVVSGDAGTRVGGAGESYSLSLPAGATATTPPVCVGLNEPTLRFNTRKNSGLLSTMTVWVDVQTSLGIWVTLPLGVDLGGGWHPSLPMLVVANLLPLLPPDQTAVRFRFAPLLGGSWQVDDVYVDPRQRG